jgi:hypothetical protein
MLKDVDSFVMQYTIEISILVFHLLFFSKFKRVGESYPIFVLNIAIIIILVQTNAYYSSKSKGISNPVHKSSTLLKGLKNCKVFSI